MLFNSFGFTIFFPIVCVTYFLIPHKYRHIWLLVASYFFYMQWSVKYVILLLLSTVITYASGILIQKSCTPKHKKTCVAVSFISNLSILFLFKYCDWVIMELNKLIELVGNNTNVSFSTLNFVLPVGISFYTFQALSYTVDVYRGDVEAEYDFFKYALFVSFFPQLVAGPIEKSKNLLSQIYEHHEFNYDRMIRGLLLMLYGYFQKLMIADRAAVFIDKVFDEIDTMEGTYIVVASVLFAIQIYCDFAGYTNIAVGAAEVMGYRLTDNFKSPYFSDSVAMFWRNWHISLSDWFKDYLYIPLGGNRKGRFRKYINIMIVFLASGLWHGASTTFVIWGGLNGLYQVVGDITKDAKQKLFNIIHVRTNTYGYKFMSKVITFILIDISWVFFRGASIGVHGVFNAFVRMITDFNVRNILNGRMYEIALSHDNFMILTISIIILFIVDYYKIKGIVIRDILMKEDIWVRWPIYIVCIIAILVFGVWGPAYDAASFIYFQF